MKKICLFGLLVSCIFMLGCENQQLGEGESIYEGELVIAGIGPETSFEPTVEEGTLVLRGYFEYHSDHIFLNEGLRKEYLKDESDYLPGNIVKFKGVVEFLDGAAGNHYYEVKSIDKLKVVNYPNEEEVMELLDGYSFCESDSDCDYIMGECPLGCYIPLNIKYIDISSNIVSNFLSNLDERCVYDCLALDKVVCENYKCKMRSSEEDEKNKDVVFCTPEQKSAENCTMIYDPVCGSDSRTYGNSCVACQSETVESYIKGECENSTFTIEGDSEYLQEN